MSQAETPAADGHTAVPSHQPDRLSPGPTSAQPDSALDMECAPKPECQGHGMTEASPPGAVHPDAPSGQLDTPLPGPASIQPESATQSGDEDSDLSSEGASNVQLDSPEQSVKDGKGVPPQGAGMGDPQPPVLAGGAVAGKAPAAQPYPCSSRDLSPSKAAKPFDSLVVTVDVLECIVGSVVEAGSPDGSPVAADAPEAEAACHALEHPSQHTLTSVTSPGLTLGAGSFDVTDQGSAAAAGGEAFDSEQLEAHTAADSSPMQLAQKLPAPPPSAPSPVAVAPGPLAAVPTAVSGAPSDQGHRSHDGGASPAGGGTDSQAHQPDMVDGWGAAAQAVDMTTAGASEREDGWGEAADGPSLWMSSQRAESSVKGKRDRCWKKKTKVSCTDPASHCRSCRVASAVWTGFPFFLEPA